jgi:hypothetical protein
MRASFRAFAAMVLFVATASASAADKRFAFDPAKEAVFLFKFQPARLNVIFFSGKPSAESFKFSLFTPARFTGTVIDGYGVGRAKAGEWLALSTIQDWTGLNPNVFTSYHLCGEAQTPVFQVKAGDVVYVGDLVFDDGKREQPLLISADIEAARAYLQANAPELAGKLTDAGTVLRHTTRKCDK